jgi:ketosteroid isomerase-like protein
MAKDEAAATHGGVHEANVAALQEVYAEWSRGNWRPRFEIYADDMEWGWSDEFLEMAGVERESGEHSTRLRDWLAPWENWRASAEEFITSGDYVVALTRYSGEGRESGVTVDTPGAHLWEFRDGKVVRLVVYSSRERALAAAGVTPGG